MARPPRGNPCGDDKQAVSSSSAQVSNEQSGFLVRDIAQLTKLRSEPHPLLRRTVPGGSKLPVPTLKMLAGREINCSGRGRFSAADNCHVLSRYLPSYGPWVVEHSLSPAYVSQFSTDGSLLVVGCKESEIRIYNVEKNWKLQKDIQAKNLRWTITDATLSPDQRFIVYSSINAVAHIVGIGSSTTESVANVTEIHEGLDFSVDEEDEDDFGIFAIKFSNDGHELVAAGSDGYIYVYDLQANKCSLRIDAHLSDVNTVCFADESGHVIYSGSDDTLCKVWDRRCFVSQGQANGHLIGHLEGVTFIDSRRDGRYLISNGKDQTTKLWDIRKMSSNTSYTPIRIGGAWDYRWMKYPDSARNLKHPLDQSLATYKGHSVLRTLIRCYFSPEYSTGQKYIYTGSTDGSVYIYDLVSGALVKTLDFHELAIRDCSWHPFKPLLISSSWDGCVCRWEFPGDETKPYRKRSHRSRRARDYNLLLLT